MQLQYLDFDFSEDGEGTGTWDAMASVTPPQWPALLHEVAQVLRWAHDTFAGQRGPVEEGGDWDFDLQCAQEVVTPQHLHYDVDERVLSVHTDSTSSQRHTLSLSLSGSAHFSVALREHFGLD